MGNKIEGNSFGITTIPLDTTTENRVAERIGGLVLNVIEGYAKNDRAGAQKTGVGSNPQAEQGHATQTPEDKAYLRALEKYEAALAKHTAAVDQNSAIDVQNKPIAEKAEFFDKMRESMLKVTTHSLAADTYLSKQELTDLLGSSDPAQRAAAEFLLANWDAIPAPKYGHWGGGMNTNEMRQWAATCGKEAESWRKQIKPHVNVPPHPGAEPPAPGAASTASQAQTGTPNTTGTDASQGPKETKAPDKKETKEELEGRVFKNYNALPPFSTDAKTSEGRLEAASNHLQKGLDALNDDLVQATLGGNQGEIMLIQNKIQKLQAGMTAIMQMMKQQQEMLSNMSKMYSEMAMSSIRNMR